MKSDNDPNIKKIKGSLTKPAGFIASGVTAGIKLSGKPDIALICAKTTSVGAAVFTKNKVQAAPVKLSKRNLSSAHTKAIIINSGNANACTGAQGLKNAEEMAAQTAASLSVFLGHEVDKSEVLVASTGIIGHQLPMDIVGPGIIKAVSKLGADNGGAAGKAILTTDLVKKDACYQAVIDGKLITISGITKGSGMIAPNMATMLAFLTTDVCIEKKALQKALSDATQLSFNRITVDGVMSTNDMAAILASGYAGNKTLGIKSPDLKIFTDLLKTICYDLGKQIVLDGEGATKLIKITVENARSDSQAEKAAFFIADSNLVKCAFFGKDPNWGRIMASLGASGVSLNEKKVDVRLGSIYLVVNGEPLNFDHKKAVAYLQGRELEVIVDLKLGSANATILTCDLSYDYVKINAEYTT